MSEETEEGESRAQARRKKRKAREESGAPRSTKKGVERAREGEVRVEDAPVLARPAVRFTYACKTGSREVGRNVAGVTVETTYAKHTLEVALPTSGSKPEERSCASCRGSLGFRYYALDAVWRPRARMFFYGLFFAACLVVVFFVAPSENLSAKGSSARWSGVIFLGGAAAYCVMRAATKGPHWTVKRSFGNRHELVAGELELLE